MSEQEMETGGEPISTTEVVEPTPQVEQVEEPTPEAQEVPKELTKSERIQNALGEIPEEPNEQLIEQIDEKTLEKILLDFGVEGEVKKVSQGPVVTLYEFEPAPGVKVSKIINLSEDIARNTSSESARISGEWITLCPSPKYVIREASAKRYCWHSMY